MEVSRMKKIMILNGAGRRNGSTATLVKAFIEGAGSSGNEVRRMGEAMLAAFRDWRAGRPSAARVDAAMLATMA